MFLVEWVNVFGRSGKAKFPTMEEVTTWINFHVQNHSFGLPERWLLDVLEGAETREVEISPAREAYSYTAFEYDENGDQIESSDYIVEVLALDAETVTEYLHPCQYSYTIKNITKKIEQEKRIWGMVKRGEMQEKVGAMLKLYIKGQQLSADVDQADKDLAKVILGDIKNIESIPDLMTYFDNAEKSTVVDDLIEITRVFEAPKE